ncbi:MAG: hypothetical protein EOO43_25315 [Flavobacterium sp.]|nr:MAG: hypothetical protein EOO43_25315 [Flavobacterium sp.]
MVSLGYRLAPGNHVKNQLVLNSLENFERRLARIVYTLMHHFDAKNLVSTVLSPVFTQIALLNQNGQFEQRDAALSTLDFLVKDLDILRYSRLSAYKKIVYDLKKQIKLSLFWGYRFELHIATLLAMKDVIFDCPDPPDFVVQGTNISIECSSKRVNTIVCGKDYKYKIRASLESKRKGAYNAPNSALFIDITNIIYSLKASSFDTEPMTLSNYVEAIIPQYNFGSVLLFGYHFEISSKKYYSSYVRVDNKIIDPSLSNFLDKHFPYDDQAGSIVVGTSMYLPIEG